MVDSRAKPKPELLGSVYCLQRAFLFILFLLVNNYFSWGQVKNVSKGNQQWIQYYNQTKLTEKWTWLLDGGYRWRDWFDQGTQYIVRTGMGYSVKDKMRLAIGVAHMGSRSSGRVGVVEFRPYQEMVIKNNFDRIGLTHRYRIEERFFHTKSQKENQASNTFNFRFRYAIMFNIPLLYLLKVDPNRKLQLGIGNELFINAGNEIVHNVFDQNRIIFSPSYQCSHKLTVALTWNNQFSATSTPSNYKHTHVFWLQIKHDLSWIKNVSHD